MTCIHGGRNGRPALKGWEKYQSLDVTIHHTLARMWVLNYTTFQMLVVWNILIFDIRMTTTKSIVASSWLTSISRLELSAAVIAVWLSVLLKSELNMKMIKTSSGQSLANINNIRRFHVFVANRVQLIRENTNSRQWHYVDTAENPAEDHASRGLCASEILSLKEVTRSTRGTPWYLLVFTPELCTEMLEDLSMDSFINALKCFISLREAVHQLYCDQCRNFLGAKNELKEALKQHDYRLLENFLAGWIHVQCPISKPCWWCLGVSNTHHSKCPKRYLGPKWQT